ncbi:spexin prohormone 1 isoform X2 [Oryzias latipes]
MKKESEMMAGFILAPSPFTSYNRLYQYFLGRGGGLSPLTANISCREGTPPPPPPPPPYSKGQHLHKLEKNCNIYPSASQPVTFGGALTPAYSIKPQQKEGISSSWPKPAPAPPPHICGRMKGLSSFSFAFFLLAAFFSVSWSAPKGSFQRRNWTPQAMLYLKGTQTRSQNTEKLSVDRAAAVLLNFLQQARDGADENPDEVYFQELPVWKRAYF